MAIIAFQTEQNHLITISTKSFLQCNTQDISISIYIPNYKAIILTLSKFYQSFVHLFIYFVVELDIQKNHTSL